MFAKLKNLKRATILGLLLAAAAVILSVRIFALQTIHHEEYESKVIEQLTTETPVVAKRGTIYDRNGKVLAENRTAYRLFISPSAIETAEKNRKSGEVTQTELIAKGLAEILGNEKYYNKVVTEAAKTKYRDRTIEKDLLDDESGIVKAIQKFIAKNDLSDQVFLGAGSIRYYPYKTLACHVIGFCSSDGHGLYGLEYQYDELLSGKNGKTVTAHDAHGNKMDYDYESYVASVDGCDLYTTLDIDLQRALDEQCEQSLINTGSNNGTCGAVMDPETGGILAMSTAPAFDLNQPRVLVDYYKKQLDEFAEENSLSFDSEEYIKKETELRQKMWANKVLTEAFMPGSTFKIITSSMVLDNKVVTDVYTKDGRCTCEGAGKLGNTTVGGVTIHCHSKHHDQSFAEGLMNSCNVTFINMGLDIGADAFYKAFKNFGYLDDTNIDLPGEGISIMHKLENLRIVELATSAFGQNFKITGIQHITAVNAVVNGGKLMQPYVVSRAVDANNNTVYSRKPIEVRRVASPETCAILRTVLEECVSGGYGGKNCYVPGYRVAAKTGTSEKIGDNKDLRIGSVMSFAPAENPVATAFFMCDEPDPEYGSTYGSTVAAPYMQALMQEILPVLGVEAKYTEAEREKADMKIPDIVGWTRTYVEGNFSREYGLKYEIIGDGNIIRYQVPSAGTPIFKKDGVIYLYTSKSESTGNTSKVPSVTGLYADAAIKTMVNKGFNVKIVGSEYYESSKSATVVAQSEIAGTELPRGTVITIYFSTGTPDD